MDYNQLQQALELFGLGERATLKDIKARHRQLVKGHHPDHNPDVSEEIIQQLNEAWRILEAYCSNYRFNFTEEEFLEQNPEERLRRQFASDPAWGGIKGAEKKK